MKKILSSIALIILIATLCATFSSCFSSASAGNPIDFGKKYVNGDTYYVFNADGTGYVNYYSKYDSTIDAKYNSTTSGVADFEWREASDGAIYLFKTAERFNENNVNSDSIPVIAHAIHFSDDCFVYSHVYNGFSNTIKYIKEGTKLADAIKNVEK